jgi:hypothetical protein
MVDVLLLLPVVLFALGVFMRTGVNPQSRALFKNRRRMVVLQQVVGTFVSVSIEARGNLPFVALSRMLLQHA